MLGFFEKLQEFPFEVALLDNPIAKIRGGSLGDGAMEAASMHATCRSLPTKPWVPNSKLLWGLQGCSKLFCLHLSLLLPADTLGVTRKIKTDTQILFLWFYKG
jgi:hypothetical protein